MSARIPRGMLPGSGPHNGLATRSYVWRDPRREAQVRAILDSIRASGIPEPEDGDELEVPTAREERLAIIASLRMNDDPHPGPEGVTLAQAAAWLGVSVRTILRYKRDVREMAGAS